MAAIGNSLNKSQSSETLSSTL